MMIRKINCLIIPIGFFFLQEGPHSTLPEDEFFDAVESGLDKIEEDRQLRVRLKLQSQQVTAFTMSKYSFVYQQFM